jgi:hypothetical protein
MVGEAETVTGHYLASLAESAQRSGEGGIVPLRNHPNRRGGMTPLLQELRVADADAVPTQQVPVGGSLVFDLSIAGNPPIEEAHVAIFLCTETRQRVAMLHSRMHSMVTYRGIRNLIARCELESLPLAPGLYTVDVAVGIRNDTLDYIEEATTLSVFPGDYLKSGETPVASQGLVVLRSNWSEVATARKAD